jgi:leucyl/phenylalanyl-tRNA---protein transferase
MVIEAFPDPERADKRGLLAIGGDLDPESLVLAYSQGIFPWPLEDGELAWFSPPKRGVLFFDELHVSRRLARTLRQSRFENRENADIPGVIAKCAEVVNRGDQGGTWITPGMVDAYTKLGSLGFCRSFETYLDSELVGGVYSVVLGRFAAGESMFFRVTDASKAAFLFMIEQLRSRGVTWLDCQVLTPVTSSFGARELPRSEYLTLLRETLANSSRA